MTDSNASAKQKKELHLKYMRVRVLFDQNLDILSVCESTTKLDGNGSRYHGNIADRIKETKSDNKIPVLNKNDSQVLVELMEPLFQTDMPDGTSAEALVERISAVATIACIHVWTYMVNTDLRQLLEQIEELYEGSCISRSQSNKNGNRLRDFTPKKFKSFQRKLSEWTLSVLYDVWLTVRTTSLTGPPRVLAGWQFTEEHWIGAFKLRKPMEKYKKLDGFSALSNENKDHTPKTQSGNGQNDRNASTGIQLDGTQTDTTIPVDADTERKSNASNQKEEIDQIDLTGGLGINGSLSEQALTDMFDAQITGKSIPQHADIDSNDAVNVTTRLQDVANMGHSFFPIERAEEVIQIITALGTQFTPDLAIKHLMRFVKEHSNDWTLCTFKLAKAIILKPALTESDMMSLLDQVIKDQRERLKAKGLSDQHSVIVAYNQSAGASAATSRHSVFFMRSEKYANERVSFQKHMSPSNSVAWQNRDLAAISANKALYETLEKKQKRRKKGQRLSEEETRIELGAVMTR